ncbi:MAB_1171c family putative transporter [Streptomyces sp. HUAS TT3]|uniref:MAB_1171c family putative transporter n=1 Tax=Streptomyces sp. HUAS TT3 TaxID=3447510 RepID=UPI003F657D09
MRPVLTVLMPALLWAVAIWRAPSALRTTASRSLWATLTAIALSLSLRPPAIDRFLEASTGVEDVTLLLKHLLSMAAICFILDYMYAVHAKPGARLADTRLRYLIAALAGTALTVLFVFFLPHDRSGAFGIDAHYGKPGVKLYLGIFYLFLGASTARAAWMFWGNRNSVRRGPLRLGVRCLATSSAVGFAYTLYRVYFVCTHGDAVALDADGRPVPLLDTTSEVLPAVALVLLVLGVSLPPADALYRYLRDQYTLWRLHPLWSDLTTAVPDVVLGTQVGRVRDLFTLGDRSLDVAHRAFAVRDAALALRDAIAPGDATDGYTGHDTDEDPARAEARWLHSAVRARADGRPVPPLPAALARTSGGRTPREETARLLRVASAYPPRGGGVMASAAASPEAVNSPLSRWGRG